MNNLKIAMYHYTRDLTHGRYPRIKGMDIPLFREQIQYMCKNFNIVKMEQVIEAVKGSEELPNNALLLTFDDGYIDNFTYAMPILEEYGIQGSFFIPGKTFDTHQLLDVNKIHYVLASANTNELLEKLKQKMDYYRGREFEYPSTEDLYKEYAIAGRWDSGDVIFIKRMLQTVLPEKLRNIISSELFSEFMGISEEQLAYELYMTRDQLRTMKRHGMYIGVHGYDHYWLGNLSEEQMKSDINMALDILDEFIDRKEWAVCYPYGNYTQSVIDYLKSQGACVGFTCEARTAFLSKDNALILPRFDCNDFPPKSDNYKLMDS